MDSLQRKNVKCMSHVNGRAKAADQLSLLSGVWLCALSLSMERVEGPPHLSLPLANHSVSDTREQTLYQASFEFTLETGK